MCSGQPPTGCGIVSPERDAVGNEIVLWGRYYRIRSELIGTRLVHDASYLAVEVEGIMPSLGVHCIQRCECTIRKARVSAEARKI